LLCNYNKKIKVLNLKNKKMQKSKKRVCLVTGSTQGIGLAIAEKLGAIAGNKVIISSRREENSQRAEERLESENIDYEYFTCDFNSKNQRLALKKHITDAYGKLDALVLTVQSMPYLGLALDVSEKEYIKMYNTNIKQTFFTIVDFLPLLKKGEKAAIVILGSHSAYYPFPYEGVFSLTKSVLLSLVKVLAQELSLYCIRVNCVNPGTVKKRIGSSILTNKLIERNYMKRDSLPHETAGICAFLTTENSSFINAQSVSVNGGMIGRL